MASRSIMIVGLGSIGRKHLKNILSLGYRNVSGVETNKRIAAEVKKEFSIPVHNSLFLGLRRARPEAVFVCSPTQFHVSNAMASLRAGAHIFIEKPLSANLKGVDNLIRLANQKKKTAMVACNYLFHPGFKKLQDVLKRRIYGKPLLCLVAQGFYMPLHRKNYKKTYIAKNKEGGGVILDHVSHAIYYLSSLFGDVKKIASLASSQHPLGFQSEELALLTLEHNSGVLSNISSDYINRKTTHRIEVVTEKGLLTLDLRSNQLVFEDGKIKKELYQDGQDPNSMFIEEIKHFLGCVRRRKKPLRGLADGQKFLKILIERKKL